MATADLEEDVEVNEHLLAPITGGWTSKIRLAQTAKKTIFGEDAKEAMQFFDGAGNWFWNNEYACGTNGFLAKGSNTRLPAFRIVINKVAEFQQLFGPTMYQQNPERTVYVRDRAPLAPEVVGNPMDPMAQQMMMALAQQEQVELAMKRTSAAILEEYLNYTPGELNLRGNVRRVIDEGIIKGAGVAWTELYQPPGSQVRLVGSFYDSIDNLFVDPDAEQWEDVKVIYRRCCHPYYEVEREYGLEPESLQGYCQNESSEVQGETDGDSREKTLRNQGRTNDLLTYYKVYSKMGPGVRMSGFAKDKNGNLNDNAVLRPVLDALADECYLVIVPDCHYPLNLPPSLQAQQFEDTVQEDGTPLSGMDQMFEAIQNAVRWPIPFWADGSWPCEFLTFHDKPNQVWPINHLKPGMGQLKFLNWAMSFLAEKVMTASNTVIGVADAMLEDIKKALTTSNGGYSILPIKELLGRNVSEFISFMQPPPFQQDLYAVIDAVSKDFEKAVGLNELIYGMQETQSRSATDINIRQQNSSVRIDDMRMKVESFSEAIARKEAIAIRWMLTAQDIAPVVGQVRAQLADQFLFNQPLDMVVREFDYKIAAGSTASRNRLQEQQNMNGAMTTLMPIFGGLIGAGQVNPANSLIEKWGSAFQIDTSGMMIQPPPPPPEMAPPPGEGGPPQ